MGRVGVVRCRRRNTILDGNFGYDIFPDFLLERLCLRVVSSASSGSSLGGDELDVDG